MTFFQDKMRIVIMAYTYTKVKVMAVLSKPQGLTYYAEVPKPAVLRLEIQFSLKIKIIKWQLLKTKA